MNRSYQVLLYDLCRLTTPKVVLSVVIAFLPTIFPKSICFECEECSYCTALIFKQFLPFVQNHWAVLTVAPGIIANWSPFLAHAIEMSYRVLAVWLIFALYFRLKQPAIEKVRYGKRWYCGVFALTGYIIGFILWHIISKSIGAADERFGIVTIVKDCIDLSVYLWFAVEVYGTVYELFGRNKSLFTIVIASTLVVVQLTGMLYRYTGLTFAPSPDFGLLLGCAYIISPVQIFLLLLLIYVIGVRRNERIHREEERENLLKNNSN